MNNELYKIFTKFLTDRKRIIESFIGENIETKPNKEFKVCINGRDYELDKEELDYVNKVYGYSETQSNCCHAEIDESGICSDCKEHAEKVINFES